MTLIFGGAYMGKRDYARTQCQAAQIETCTGLLPAFDEAGTAGLEQFSLACARNGADSVELLAACRDRWQDRVLICRDISCGVVPLDATERAWREENGRMLRYLAEQADRVVRVWYGLGQVLK